MGTEAVKTEEENWWDWLNPARESIPDNESDDRKREYFDNLVKRCVLVEALSHKVTAQVLQKGFDQFATVLAIKVLRSPLLQKNSQHTGMAVLETEKPEKAAVVVSQLREYMIMIGGMPRPARAHLAKVAMLADHPLNRRRNGPIVVNLLQRTDENQEAKLKKVKEQVKGATYLHQLQKKAEGELSKKQEENYKDLKRKYTSIKDNKDLKELRRAYNINPRR